MSDDLDDGCGCFGCLIAIAMTLIGIGLVGFAWKFLVWAWT